MHLKEVYRFENRLVEKNGHLCWEMDRLWQNVLAGLKACKGRRVRPRHPGHRHLGASTLCCWTKPGSCSAIPSPTATGARRGERDRLAGTLPFAEHYARTGIQYQPFNTAYQLTALGREHPTQLAAAKTFLMVPDYLNYKLTGRRRQRVHQTPPPPRWWGRRAGTGTTNSSPNWGLPRGIFQPIRMRRQRGWAP